MKYIKYICIGMMFISSCSEDFINLSPISNKSADGLFETEEGFEQAVIGAYDGLQRAAVTAEFPAILSEQRSDNSFQDQVVSSNNDLSVTKFTVSSANPLLNQAWSQLYTVINRCNNVLVHLDDIELDAAKKDQYTGEVKFIRALMYFDLVRYFGDVPLVTSTLSISEALDVLRSSVEDVYAVIIEDLEDAIDKLPASYASAEVGRATTYAAQGLLGRVYMTRSGYPLQTNEWTKARDLFQGIIQSGAFNFAENYADNFDVANENGGESVFSIQFKAGVDGEGNPIPTRNAPNLIDKEDPLGLPFGGSPSGIWVSEDFINSFEAEDVRLSESVRLEWRHTDGSLRTDELWSQKFVSGTPVNANDWDINWPVIRYTDVMMMYAEALNELGYAPDGEAFDIINQVRTRAGLLPKTSTDVPNQQAFRLWIEEERRHEFAFENLRWHDLVRTDRALDVMKSFLSNYGLQNNVKSKDQYIYPIPLREMEVNPMLSQNPGYE